MKNTIAWFGLLAGLGLAHAGCVTVTWVNDVTTTPDGSQVVVVGAEYTGELASKPLRWVCLRAQNGRLNCQPDSAELPRMGEPGSEPPPPPPRTETPPTPAATTPPAPPPTPEPTPAPPPPPVETVAPPPPSPAAGGCTSDGDCKGSRVCRGGQCVAP